MSSIIERFHPAAESYFGRVKPDDADNWGETFFSGAPYDFDRKGRSTAKLKADVKKWQRLHHIKPYLEQIHRQLKDKVLDGALVIQSYDLEK